VHAPLEHVPPTPQLMAHAPQFIGSFATFTQWPLHDASPLGHAHTPATHVAGSPHACPHTPQLLESVMVSTQTIEAPVPHACVRGAVVHAIEHWPATHA
jgi:hypothetical protein